MDHTMYDLTLLSLSYMFPNYANINGKEGKKNFFLTLEIDEMNKMRFSEGKIL